MKKVINLGYLLILCSMLINPKCEAMNYDNIINDIDTEDDSVNINPGQVQNIIQNRANNLRRFKEQVSNHVLCFLKKIVEWNYTYTNGLFDYLIPRPFSSFNYHYDICNNCKFHIWFGAQMIMLGILVPESFLITLPLCKADKYMRKNVKGLYDDKKFLSINNADKDKLMKANEIQEEFYCAYDEFANNIYNAVENNNLSLDDEQAINNVLHSEFNKRKKDIDKLGKSVKECIHAMQSNECNLLTSFRRIKNYRNIKTQLNSIMLSFITNMSNIDSSSHDYKRVIHELYRKFSEEIYYKFFSNHQYSINELQLTWARLIIKNIEDIRKMYSKLQELQKSFPGDGVIDYFNKYYPFIIIQEISNKYCKDNRIQQ